MANNKEKVFEVMFRTPNGKEWCHMIATTAQEAMNSIPGAYNAVLTELDPKKDASELSLPEWMM